MTSQTKNRLLMVALAAAFMLMGFMSVLIINKLFAPKDTAQTVATNATNADSSVPKLTVSPVINGLDHPWEVAFLPDETMIITERSGAISKISGSNRTIIYQPNDVVAQGEGGMLGLGIDPDFANNRFIYACFNTAKDIRVARFKVNVGVTALDSRTDIVTGLPANPSGRHSGCRIAFGPDKNLWIGTGDAAQATNPQDLKSLGGKILRVDRDGKAAADNLGGSADPRIYSYGHRNIQGIAFFDELRNGSYGVSVEHGSDVDDEVNPLTKGNFGWNPGSGYDESVPMTDSQKFPSAISAIWHSGNPTIAPSDAVFLKGDKWGKWQGRLAVAVLKAKHLRLLELKISGVGEELRLLDGEYGRLRATALGPDGSLYITTDNGTDDRVLKVMPS